MYTGNYTRLIAYFELTFSDLVGADICAVRGLEDIDSNQAESLCSTTVTSLFTCGMGVDICALRGLDGTHSTPTELIFTTTKISLSICVISSSSALQSA